MVIVYDDYNSRIKYDNIIGTLTCQFGSITLRNAFKLIEIYDSNSVILE